MSHLGYRGAFASPSPPLRDGLVHLMPLGIGIPRVCKTYSCLNVANLYKHVSVYIYVKPKIVAEEKNTLLVMG